MVPSQSEYGRSGIMSLDWEESENARVSKIAATDTAASGPAETRSMVEDCDGTVVACSGGFRMSHITVL
jgi:hypothetical protein